MGRYLFAAILCGVLVSCTLISVAPGAQAGVRIGGGAGLVDHQAVPVGRVDLDVISLWFLRLSLDQQFWIPSPEELWLFPFFGIRTSLIFDVAVGLAPVLTLSRVGGISFPGTLALKGELGASVGPLGAFGEAVMPVAPAPASVGGGFTRGRLFFAAGLILRF